jgi:dipeptidyl aminopeptidase/acylaminoacyl peptidase
MRLTSYVALVVVIVVAGCRRETPRTRSLDAARAALTTKLRPFEAKPDRFPPLPDARFQLVTYPGPVGALRGLLALPDQALDGGAAGRGRGPAIVWVAGGFPPGGAGAVWEPRDPRNDQSAAQYREAGLSVLYPTTRGATYGNPGQEEQFLGEVDDVLAAVAYLRTLPFVDPDRVTLGGHSTGGTLALLAAERGGAMQGVIAFGPTDDIGGYGQNPLRFDVGNAQERAARSPGLHLGDVVAPTLVIEGSTGNSEALRAMRAENRNPAVTFLEISGATHFTVIAPLNALLAGRLADPAEHHPLRLGEAQAQAEFDRSR